MARIKVTGSGADRIKLKLDDWVSSATNRANVLVYNPIEVDDKDMQKDYFDKQKMLIKINADEGPFRNITFVEILG